MNNFFRALIAGAAAKKFGGGCLGTIVIFILVWVALGYCNNTSKRREPVYKEKTGINISKPAKQISLNTQSPKVYHYSRQIGSKAVL
ncbi:hypothetical protein [Rhodocytophaga rosea]|uniref:hypothetical protein n=1 Tax=Rhodocytophaga rosea TaxID=2704465 RepID=UPI00139138C5|nr:hypothetical protein [Rhodocytophaga rosea]